mgnify:CR=1 FL=1
MIEVYTRKGFTLMECVLAFCLFSIVITTAISLYLTGYKIYRRQENLVEIEQNSLVILNRISETLRRTDNLSQNLYVSDTVLIIENTRYYYQSGNVHERIGMGTNNLGGNISLFEPRLEDGFLTVKLEGIDNQGGSPFSIEQVFFIGDE